MRFFQSINFYLTSEECKAINKIREEIESKISKDLIMMRIVYRDLNSNSEMNERYYLNE